MKKYIVNFQTMELRGRYETHGYAVFDTLEAAEDYMQQAIDAIESTNYVTYSDEASNGAWIIEYGPKMQTKIWIVAA